MEELKETKKQLNLLVKKFKELIIEDLKKLEYLTEQKVDRNNFGNLKIQKSAEFDLTDAPILINGLYKIALEKLLETELRAVRFRIEVTSTSTVNITVAF